MIVYKQIGQIHENSNEFSLSILIREQWLYSGSGVSHYTDPIEDLYNMYSEEEEEEPRIVELGDMDLDFGLEDGPVDPFLEL